MKRTIDTIYWLGAGFSRESGGPLIKDFFSKEGDLNKILEHKYLNDQMYHRFNYSKLTWFYDRFKSFVGEEETTIEDFFNFSQSAQFIGGQFKRANISYKANTIHKWLTDYIACFINDRIDYANIPEYYTKFINHCFNNKSAVITFNYDLILETLFDKIGASFNYNQNRSLTSLRQGITSVTSGIDYLKLHGSLNWMTCSKCKKINIFRSINSFAFSQRCRKSNCNGKLRLFIVPPVWGKNKYATLLKPLWKRALDLLENAKRIVVIGYSFPNYDLLALSLVRAAVLINHALQIEVVNGTKSDYSKFEKTPEVICNKIDFKDYASTL